MGGCCRAAPPAVAVRDGFMISLLYERLFISAKKRLFQNTGMCPNVVNSLTAVMQYISNLNQSKCLNIFLSLVKLNYIYDDLGGDQPPK
jgi:hypothetical protein